MIGFVFRGYFDRYVENGLVEIKFRDRRQKDQCRRYVGIQVRYYGYLRLYVGLECIRWLDFRKFQKVELIGFGDRCDMDGIGKGKIQYDIEIVLFFGFIVRLIVGLFIEIGNLRGRVDLEVKTLNFIWDVLI